MVRPTGAREVRGVPKLCLVGALAALAPGTAAHGAPGACSELVALPEALAERNELNSECPADLTFLKQLEQTGFMSGLKKGVARSFKKKEEPAPSEDGAQKQKAPEEPAPSGGRAQRKKEAQEGPAQKEAAARSLKAAPADTPGDLAQETAAGDAPPDCRHELAMRPMWHRLMRADLDGTQIVEGANYEAKLYRAPPQAFSPTVTHGRLTNVTLHVPGVHTVGDHRIDAELHFGHEGMRTLWGTTGPGFTLVVPMEVNWAWDAKRDPLLEWLSRPRDYFDRSECAWNFAGTMSWIGHGFRCPPYHVSIADVFSGGSRAVHYSAGSACQNTFVLTDAIEVSGEQLAEVRHVVRHADTGREDFLEPQEVIVAGALRPFEAFTVFTEAEVRARQAVYMSGMTAGLVLMIGAFMLVKRFSDVYELEMIEYARDPCVVQNARIDHWVSHIAAIVIPWTAYYCGASNSNSGMPYEYISIWYGFVMLHMIHELVMFVQVGGAVQRIRYWRVVRNVVKSFMGLLHYELYIQFSIIALMHGSVFAYMSIVTFVVCNVCGQLILLSTSAPPNVVFRARAFEVINAVFDKRIAELKEAGVLDQKLQDAAREMAEINGEGEEDREVGLLTDSGIEGMLNCCASTGDLLQFVFQVIFVLHNGPCPVMTASILLSLIYLVTGFVAAQLAD